MLPASAPSCSDDSPSPQRPERSGSVCGCHGGLRPAGPTFVVWWSCPHLADHPTHQPCWTTSATAPTSSFLWPTVSRPCCWIRWRAQRRTCNVRVHQMHALVDRGTTWTVGTVERSATCPTSSRAVTRPHLHSGGLDLVPAHFSEVPLVLRPHGAPPVDPCGELPAGSPRLLLPRHQRRLRRAVHRAVADLPGGQPTRCPGRSVSNMVHESQVVGWTRGGPSADLGRAERSRTTSTTPSRELIAERVPDRATIQTGIGSIPNAVIAGALGTPRPRRAHRARVRRDRRPRRSPVR